MLDQIGNQMSSNWGETESELVSKRGALDSVRLMGSHGLGSAGGSRKRQRSDVSAAHGSVKSMKTEYKKGLWDKEEDVKLLELVKQQQQQFRADLPSKQRKLNWTIVSKGMKTRSCKQCRERWVNHLNPGVRKTKWTPEEDTLLLELARQNPRKWAQIARQMPGRTENMVKIRWNSLNKQSSNRSPRSSVRRSCTKSAPPATAKIDPQQQIRKEIKYDTLPFIKNTIADYCGHAPEYLKAEPFVEDVFLDDYFLDSFFVDNTQTFINNRNRNNTNFGYDNLVPINL